MVFSIRNTASVRCSVGVRLSEGPLWEVPLYMRDREGGRKEGGRGREGGREAGREREKKKQAIKAWRVCVNHWEPFWLDQLRSSSAFR